MEKCTIPGLGHRNYKMSLEYPYIVPKSFEVLKGYGGHIRWTEKLLYRVPLHHIWHNLYIKMNNNRSKLLLNTKNALTILIILKTLKGEAEGGKTLIHRRGPANKYRRNDICEIHRKL